MADGIFARLAEAFMGSKATIPPSGTGGTGAGIFGLMNDTPTWRAKKNPHALMRQAQQLFHTNPWVMAAERVISGSLSTLPWHLEADDDDTIDESSTPEQRAWLELIERPQKNAQVRQRTTDTRAKLWRITGRHVGLCGNAFWYLDELPALGGGPPRALMYLNPALMYPEPDKSGNLAAWVYKPNPDTETGVRFRLDEVLHFVLEPPDDGVFGIGIVEAAGLAADLTTLSTRHAAQTMASGGRLPGVFSPKTDRMPDDLFDNFSRSIRNVVELPDASKRTLVSQAPIDFTVTAADPQKLDLVSIAGKGRDDILALWGVPGSQLGLETRVGLNSGQNKAYDEAVLHQRAVAPRLRSMVETIQYDLFDQQEAGLTLEVDEPSFDDELPRYEALMRARYAPMTVDQRLALLGQDALDETLYGSLGATILIDKSMVTLDSIMAPAPAPVPFAVTPPEPTGTSMVDAEEGETATNTETVKASGVVGIRERAQSGLTPPLQRTLLTFLRAQGEAIAGRIRDKAAHLTKRPKDTDAWWDAKHWDTELANALRPHLGKLVNRVTGQMTSILEGRSAKASSWEDELLDELLTSVGTRVTDINVTTRDAIRELVARGIADGLSPAELGDLIQGATPFDEARAEMIARTELMNTYNAAAIGSYREFGVEKVQAIDGDVDEECAKRNGMILTLDEASGVSDHPNGTLDWVPVV